MNDRDEDTQREQSGRRITQRIEAGEYADGVMDQRVSKLERRVGVLESFVRAVVEAVRKFTTDRGPTG